MFVMEEKWPKTEPFLLKGDWQGMGGVGSDGVGMGGGGFSIFDLTAEEVGRAGFWSPFADRWSLAVLHVCPSTGLRTCGACVTG